jgi:LAS superfamily LD-carboxypeptidase LdcB
MNEPWKPVTLDATLKRYGNGKLPEELLKPIHAGGRLYGPAAFWCNVMFSDARKDGVMLRSVSAGYRSYAAQEALFLKRYSLQPTGRKPTVTRRWNGQLWYLKAGASPAASPGKSNHGYGLAQDFSVPAKTFAWLCKNAPRYGFYLQGPRIKDGKPNPEWEAWHWQFCNL